MKTPNQTKVDRFGRVLIPKAVREALGWEQDRLLRLVLREGGLLLTPLEDRPPLACDEGVWIAQGTPREDLRDFERRERQARLDHMEGPAQ